MSTRHLPDNHFFTVRATSDHGTSSASSVRVSAPTAACGSVPTFSHSGLPNGKEKWVLFVSINPAARTRQARHNTFRRFRRHDLTPRRVPYPLWLDYGRDNYAGDMERMFPKRSDAAFSSAWMSNWDYSNERPHHIFPQRHDPPPRANPRRQRAAHGGKQLSVKEVLPAVTPWTYPAMNVNGTASIGRLLPDKRCHTYRHDHNPGRCRPVRIPAHQTPGRTARIPLRPEGRHFYRRPNQKRADRVKETLLPRTPPLV